MKPRKFKINLNNFNDYICGIPFENSIGIVTTEQQMRHLDRMIELGDYKFEEIIDEPQPEKTTFDFAEHDVEGRGGDVEPDIKVDPVAKKPGRPRNSDRSRPKKQRSNTKNK